MRRISLVAMASAIILPLSGHAQDEGKAQATMKASGCSKCHSVSADKDGPSFKATAAKYKGQADAAAKIEGELKNGVMKVDGKDVKHAVAKGSDADVKNVVAYILSR